MASSKLKTKFKHFLQFMLAVMLIPVVYGVLQASLTVFMVTRMWISAWPIMAGALVYMVIHLALYKPMVAYVFAHELTHALAGVLSGSRIKSFKVSSRGGSVTMSKTNLFIALAPYFIPIYALFIILVFRLVGIYYNTSKIWYLHPFLIGFALAFHIMLTFHVLSQKQPDLERASKLFCLVLILISNCVVLVLIMRMIFPEDVSLGWFLKDVYTYSFSAWKAVYHAGRVLYGVARSYI